LDANLLVIIISIFLILGVLCSPLSHSTFQVLLEFRIFINFVPFNPDTEILVFHTINVDHIVDDLKPCIA
jgi:hypothetical protein